MTDAVADWIVVPDRVEVPVWLGVRVGVVVPVEVPVPVPV